MTRTDEERSAKLRGTIRARAISHLDSALEIMTEPEACEPHRLLAACECVSSAFTLLQLAESDALSDAALEWVHP